MQTFVDENEGKNKVVVGDHEVKIVKAASLAVGIHKARFYPLSVDFYKGGDYISIVQHIHWFNNQPCICRATSRDYTVPEIANKPKIDTADVICSDKFAWFAKAAKLGWKKNSKFNPPEAIRCHNIGVDLMDKISAASIVSFEDSSGKLTFPVILRYGKELLTQLELHASRILNATGVHICDPVTGYMFDITIGKNSGGFRTYKDSMPSVDSSPRDITGAPWKWEEVCTAIKTEIIDIPTPEETMEFYTKNYGSASGKSEFAHPSFQQEVSRTDCAVDTEQVTNFPPPKEESKEETKAPPAFSAPAEKSEATNFSPPPKVEAPAFVPPEKKVEIPKCKPCNGILPNSTGYDREDAQCKTCNEAEKCYYATEKRDAAKGNVANGAVGTGAIETGAIETGDIKKELAMLNQKIANN